jgi:hypothetical protein
MTVEQQPVAEVVASSGSFTLEHNSQLSKPLRAVLNCVNSVHQAGVTQSLTEFAAFASGKLGVDVSGLVSEYVAAHQPSLYTVSGRQRRQVTRSTRQPNAYNVFVKERMATIKESHPDADQKTFMAIIAKEWNEQKAAPASASTPAPTPATVEVVVDAAPAKGKRSKKVATESA